MSEIVHLIVGGFLGAGKTTAIRAIGRHLAGRGLRVAMITNDQSQGLVDTALLRAEGFPVEEIAGGCFCCRFDELVGVLQTMSAREQPNVILAEPVGCCTDLVATVTQPLRRIYGEAVRIPPLSVLVDPIRAERMLGLEPGRSFSSNVIYVYMKQLEEAAAIVINKCDLVSPERQDRLEAALRRTFTRADVRRVSARTGAGVADWVDRWMAGGSGAESVAGVDQDRYMDGEARLGWVNETAVLRAGRDVDGNALLQSLAAAIRASLDRVEIAHLKMILVPAGQGGDIGVINLVRTDTAAEISPALKAPLSAGRLLINLRAEAPTELLREAVAGALGGGEWSLGPQASHNRGVIPE